MKILKNNLLSIREFIDDIKYLFSYIYQRDKKLLLWYAIYSICDGITPFIGLFIPKLFIDQITHIQGGSVAGFDWLLVALGVLWIIITVFAMVAKARFNPRLFRMFLNFAYDVGDTAMEMDYAYTEEPSVLNLFETASLAARGMGMGLYKVITSSFALIGNAIGVIGVWWIFGSLSWVMLVYLVVIILVENYILLKGKQYNVVMREGLAPNERKASYLHYTMMDFAYGKDIRIFSCADWLKSYYEKIKLRSVAIYRDINGRYIKIGWINAGLLFLREGVALLYLVYSVMEGNISLGDFALYLSAVAALSIWLSSLFSSISDICAQHGYVEDFKKFLQLSPEYLTV